MLAMLVKEKKVRGFAIFVSASIISLLEEHISVDTSGQEDNADPHVCTGPADGWLVCTIPLSLDLSN